LKLARSLKPEVSLLWSIQVGVCDPNCTLVARQVVPMPTFAVTVAFITLPGGADVLATPSMVAALVVIAAVAALGDAARATAENASVSTTP
jgi:hypothetical protein